MENRERSEFMQEPVLTRKELEKRMADIEGLMAKNVINTGARRALEESMEQIKKELAELDSE